MKAEQLDELFDRQAERIGVTRQSIIKVWIAEKIKADQAAASG